MTETCPYCKASVPDGLMGYHYAGATYRGVKMPACREVEGAFGRWIFKRGDKHERALPPDTYAKAQAHRHCKEPGCAERIYKADRCYTHFQAERRRQNASYRDRHRQQLNAAARRKYHEETHA